MRRLDLAVPGSARARAAAIGLVPALEDAFNTVSVPGVPPSAHVVIRRLDLGAVDPTSSPAHLAGTIEARLRELGAAIVCVDEREVESARAVYFSDFGYACSRLLTLIARGRPLTAWYWRSIVGVRVDPTAAVRTTLERLSRDPATVVRQARILATLTRRGLLGRVLKHVDAATGQTLAASSGAADMDTVQPRSILTPAATIPDAVRSAATAMPIPDVTATWIRRWGPADPRTYWLALQTVLAQRPEWLGTPLAHLATRVVVTRTLTGAAKSAVSASGAAVSGPVPRPLSGASTIRSRDATTPVAVAQGRSAENDAPRDHSNAGGVYSGHAGLALVVPALLRVGATDLLARHPVLLANQLPQRLITRLADRLAVPDDDPVRDLARIDPVARVPATVPVDFIPPDAWQGLDRNAAAASGTIPLADAGAALMRVMLRYLHRHARMNVAELIPRPGAIVATPTHFDVVFDSRWVDIRLRRAGLDLDPGWVPWLGRVVQFHYRSLAAAAVGNPRRGDLP